MSKQQMKRIDLNEEYALSADTLNIILLIQTKIKMKSIQETIVH